MADKPKDMGEVARETIAKNREEAASADELRKRLETPISEAEARKAFADIDMSEARLLLLKEQLLGQLNQVDQQLAACRCARAEVGCRLTAPAKPEGEG